MTNPENQRRLDNKRIREEIQNNGKSMAGKMYYCLLCHYNKGGICISNNEERISKSLCSTADNRLKRRPG